MPFTSIATLYPGEGVYLKQGIYRVAQPSDETVFIDGTRGGKSYSSVVADFPAREWRARPKQRQDGSQRSQGLASRFLAVERARLSLD